MLQPERKTNKHTYVRGFDYSVKLRTSAAAENFERVPKKLLIDTWPHMSVQFNSREDCKNLSLLPDFSKTYRTTYDEIFAGDF